MATLSKKKIAFFSITTILIILSIVAIKYLFFTDKLKYIEIGRSYNEDSNVYLVGYLGNCGALCTYTVKVNLEDPFGKVIRSKVYYSMRCGETNMKWIDNTTAEINGVVINVYEDRFDGRNENGSICPYK